MSLQHLKEAVAKLAAGSVETNEDRTVPGKANVYLPPPGHTPNVTGGNAGHSKAVEEAAKDTREDMAERLFDSLSTSAPAEQALIHSLFNRETVDAGHLPHSIMQRRGRVKTASDETLTDKVLRITGRR